MSDATTRPDPTALPAVVAGTPSAPPDMSATEIEEARHTAVLLVREVSESAGSRQLAVLDEVSSFGVQAQRNAGRQLELLKTRLGTLVDAGDGSGSIASDLADLRTTLDRINPASGRRVLRWLPKRGGAATRALRRITMRYEPVAKQVDVIETRLRDGRQLLVRDNLELRRLYADVETQQQLIARQAFLGEVLLHELDALAATTDDPLERDRLAAAVHDVATRVQDLRTMQEVHTQYFVSIELTRQNNVRLGQAVDRTVSLASNVVTVGLALQAALARQRAVHDATVQTREFIATTITRNAAAIRQQTEDIGDLYKDPVVALDKLADAHRDLLAALETASRLREEGTDSARRTITELTAMTQELSAHVGGIEDEEGRSR